MSGQMTRRTFVEAGLVLGAGVAVLGAAGCSAAADSQSGVETPSSSYGEEDAMSKRVLVGYATRNGSTVGVAEEIGRTLGTQGHSVDVKPMKEAPSLDGYDAVVLGSAINGGKWLPEAVDYVERNTAALRGLPVAVFCVHAMNTGDDERDVKKRTAYIDSIREMIEPAQEGYFAGVGPKQAESSAFTRWMFRAFGGDVEGDGRDWDKIRAWAREAAI